jgi:hypothetical protein
MSNPTSNFGWQMPTATDLVTDLPADFEVFGQAVDTDLADLNGGTTGQILSKTSNTDLDFTWINNDQGDITGVTAGTGISGGGTSGTVTVTNSMATAFTTSGDLIQATGSGTFARLGTGTNGQYLTTNGTTNSWATVSAGSLTLLSTTTLSGSSTSITGISQDYVQLYITFVDVWGNATADRLKFNFNTDTTSGNYYSNQLFIDNATTGREMSFTNGYFGNGVMNQNQNLQLRKLNGYLKLHNYTDTGTKWADMSVVSMSVGTNTYAINGGGIYIGGSAISSIQVGLTAGTFTAGTVKIYGVK